MTGEYKEWQDRYQNGTTPWDTGRVDRNFVKAFESGILKPCSALEIGCGTGTNSLWFDSKGFVVTGLDLSQLAIDKAKEKNKKNSRGCRFFVHDILKDSIPEGPYSLVFDRGCFHTFVSSSDQSIFVRKVSESLSSGGLWYSLIASSDGPPREGGPPRHTVSEIASVVEPCFEIQSMISGYFDSDRPEPPNIWVCLMKKRTFY